MPTYDVSMRVRPRSSEVRVEANSPEEAINQVMVSDARIAIKRAVLDPECVTEIEKDVSDGAPVEIEAECFEVLGRCEGCEVWLLEGRTDYVHDSESGVDLCRPCSGIPADEERDE